MNTGAILRRLFFACWPDQHIRAELVARRALIEGCSRRRVPDHNLHLTLLFLGNQPQERIHDIQLIGEKMSGKVFDFCLDRYGWFPRARVAWLGGDAPVAARRLVSELTEAADALGLVVERRRFRPHVTLFRQVEKRPDFPVPEPLRWRITEFSLIESIPSRPYQVLRSWQVG